MQSKVRSQGSRRADYRGLISSVWVVGSLASTLAVASPMLSVSDRPSCRFVGTEQEGWYWQIDEKLIQLGACSQFSEPSCEFVGTRSEGWYSEGWMSIYGIRNLLTWDSRCHRQLGLSLRGESCGDDSGYQCVGSLHCVNAVCSSFLPVAPLLIGRSAANQTFKVDLGQEVIVQLDRGPVQPCFGGAWLETSLTYDATILKDMKHEVIDNPNCPSGRVGCHHDMDQFTFRIGSHFTETSLTVAMQPAPQWCENRGSPVSTFAVNFRLSSAN